MLSGMELVESLWSTTWWHSITRTVQLMTDRERDHWLETYKSLITISVEGFKFLALANGGSAVALLAYLGNVAGKSLPTPDMRCPMFAFLSGLAFCALSMLFSYFTQLKLLNEIGRSERRLISHQWHLWGAIFMFLCSIFAFGFGSWQAVIRFR